MARGLVDLATATEAALIIASQARDQRAFAELVKRRQGWARALLRRMCVNHAEADDLAQEAFMKAWQRLRDLEKPAAFPGWFRRIAVTTFLMAKRKSRGIHETLDDAIPLADEQSLPDSQAGARIDLERALKLLSDGERLCVTLNHAEGMSHAEIVETTGLPLGTVKSHINRGTDKLRRLLAPEASAP
ncbi:MAG: sigma-70 family RNA polymerase sigma factor [Alphaproteobacteria bacterium]|nr:sigma-70 family RNA polymerase sigma factor [Alphaproteobacteria bacterium]